MTEKRIHGDLDLDGKYTDLPETPEKSIIEPAAKPKPLPNEDRNDECVFSKEIILSVGPLPYRQIRGCLVHPFKPCTCPPSDWKDKYKLCEVRKKNVHLHSEYEARGFEARMRDPPPACIQTVPCEFALPPDEKQPANTRKCMLGPCWHNCDIYRTPEAYQKCTPRGDAHERKRQAEEKKHQVKVKAMQQFYGEVNGHFPPNTP